MINDGPTRPRPLRDDPVLRLVLEMDLDDNAHDLIRRLRLLGRHKFADALEAQTLDRAGFGPHELARRLAPTSPGWFARALQRAGLGPDALGRIW